MPVTSVPANRRPCGFRLRLYAERLEHLCEYVESFPGAFVDIVACDHGGYQAEFTGQRWEIAGLLAKCRAETNSPVWQALLPVTKTTSTCSSGQSRKASTKMYACPFRLYGGLSCLMCTIF